MAQQKTSDRQHVRYRMVDTSSGSAVVFWPTSKAWPGPETDWRRLKRDHRKRCLARGCDRREAYRFSAMALAFEYAP